MVRHWHGSLDSVASMRYKGSVSHDLSVALAARVGAVIIASILLGAMLGRPDSGRVPDAEAPLVASPVPIVEERATLTVHVAGAVVSPGLIELPVGSRVADAIAAGGGAIAGADLVALNLAQPLIEGQQVVVPWEGEVSQGVPGAAAGVRLNDADAAELESLPGVGPVLAASIVTHRETHGPFAIVEDLLLVPGIGESKLASLRDRVIVP